MKDIEREAEEVILAYLEELVAGKDFEDVGEAGGVVAALDKARPRQNAGHLLSEERNVPGGLIIGLGGEQAHEPHLAAWLAAGTEPTNADVVHVDPTMDPRAEIGFGHHDGVAGFELPP